MIWDHDDIFSALMNGESLYVVTRNKPLRPIVVPYRSGMHPWEARDQAIVHVVSPA